MYAIRSYYVHRIINVITLFIQDSNQGKPRYLNYVSIIESILGIGIIWAGFNLFFTDQIDYNSRYVIGGVLLVGFAFLAFSIADRIRSRVLRITSYNVCYTKLLRED